MLSPRGGTSSSQGTVAPQAPPPPPAKPKAILRLTSPPRFSPPYPTELLRKKAAAATAPPRPTSPLTLPSAVTPIPQVPDQDFIPSPPPLYEEERVLEEDEVLAAYRPAKQAAVEAPPEDNTPYGRYVRMIKERPPYEVLPHDISLSPLPDDMVKVSTVRGVGLLRKLSLDKLTLQRIYRQLEALPATLAWNVVRDELFGTHSKDDFLGYSSGGGNRSALTEVATYDSLGHFPLFRDEQGREYFPVGGYDLLLSSGQPFRLGVRLPRHLTTIKKKGLDQEFLDWGFPCKDQSITLHFGYIPFIPIYYDVFGQIISTIVQEASGRLLDTWFLEPFALQKELKRIPLQATIRSLDPLHRDATAVVDVEWSPQTLNNGEKLLYLVKAHAAWRLWNNGVLQLFHDVMYYDSAGGRLVLSLIRYLHKRWLRATSFFSNKR